MNVAVAVGVFVAVDVGDGGTGVFVDVGDGVSVGVRVGGTGAAVGISAGVGEGVLVEVSVAVRIGTNRVDVAVCVAVDVGSGVSAIVACGDDVGVKTVPSFGGSLVSMQAAATNNISITATMADFHCMLWSLPRFQNGFATIHIIHTANFKAPSFFRL